MPRRAAPGDGEAVRSCLEAGFSSRYDDARAASVLAALGEGASLVVEHGALVVGALVAHEVELTLPCLDGMRARCVSDLAVRPTHRRRGVLRALMGAALGQAHEQGEAIAVLGASEAGIYPRFGWGAATHTASYRVDRRSASLLASARPSPGTVALLEPGPASAVLPAVLDAARRRRAGEISRRPDAWPEVLAAGGDRQSAPCRFVAAYLDGGQVEGYALYEVRGAGEERREVVLVECATTGDAAYVALFGYLVGIDLTDALRTGERPVDEPVRHLLDDPRALETVGTSDGAWLRLIDARTCLERRGYSAAGRVVLEVHDATCPWNEGRWSIETDADGETDVTATTDPAEIELGASELAALYLGGTRATSLRSAGRVLEHERGAALRLDTLLYCDPVPFCTAL
ncbi:MAG: GNAT family N-acetyltransferase [Actinomycetota bacterium]|nr:GNAT family N-acetyltransferase [Actinomycetota bacterium]